MSETLSFDVAIAGAGPAGSAAAIWLARSGCRVVLLEASRFERHRIGESLAPAVQPLLAELGVWARFRELQPLPSYGTRSRWGSTEPLVHSHLVSPYGCGWHVDRASFDQMLAGAAAEAGTALHAGTSVAGCERTADGSWRIRARRAGGTGAFSIAARVLVDATGRAARLARQVPSKRIVFDRLVAIGTLFRGVDVSRQTYVLVEAVEEGWWYSAPIPPDRMVVMLMTDSDLCGRAFLSSPTGWRGALARTSETSQRTSDSMDWGPRVFSAISQRVRSGSPAQPWLAVGDAALAVDPISGSGVVRALRSAKEAAHATLALLQSDHCSAINAYETGRDQDCETYLAERVAYYGLERRWEQAPFWSRRIGQTAILAGA